MDVVEVIAVPYRFFFSGCGRGRSCPILNFFLPVWKRALLFFLQIQNEVDRGRLGTVVEIEGVID